MQAIKYPVNFEFKIGTLANDFIATDGTGRQVAYVRQKMFKLKEDIQIYNDDTRTKLNYTIKADRWLDFSAAYSFYDDSNKSFGKIVRKGWKSLWKAEYQIIDQRDIQQYSVTEENAWVKIIDGILGQIPIINIFTGYFFNPAYLVNDMKNQSIVKLKKQASFFGRSFELTQLGQMDTDDDDRIMLGLMMMILLERRRG